MHHPERVQVGHGAGDRREGGDDLARMEMTPRGDHRGVAAAVDQVEDNATVPCRGPSPHAACTTCGCSMPASRCASRTAWSTAPSPATPSPGVRAPDLTGAGTSLRANDRPSDSSVADQTVPAAPAPSRPNTR